MWLSSNPNCWPEFKRIKEMVELTQLTPIREWMMRIEETESALIIREWPNGAVTSYMVVRTG